MKTQKPKKIDFEKLRKLAVKIKKFTEQERRERGCTCQFFQKLIK